MPEVTSSPDTVVSTERVFAAPPQRVFAAIENADQMARWWGPADFTNTFKTYEFKPGGKWVFDMHGPNGINYPNESVFREIEPGKRVVIEHVVKPWYLLTVTLTEQGTGTLLKWNQEFENAAIAAKMRKLSAKANEEVLDKLQAVLGT